MLPAIRVVSSVYLRLLVFLPEMLIPACDSLSLAFCLMSSAYKLNKQSDNVQLCDTHSQKQMKQKKMFVWNSLAFSMIQRMLAIWILVHLCCWNPAFTSISSQFTYCWSLAWRILNITLLVCGMSKNVHLFQHSLALSFFGTGMHTDFFPILWSLLSFPNLLTYWV